METDPEFEAWHKLHQSLEKRDVSNLFFKEKEVWFCSIGKNIGSEQNGKHELFERPVLIFKKFNNNTFLGFPLTSKIRDPLFHFRLGGPNEDSFIILSQIRLFDRKRLNRKLNTITNREYYSILKSFIKIMKMDLGNSGTRTFLCGFLGALRRSIPILTNW